MLRHLTLIPPLLLGGCFATHPTKVVPVTPAPATEVEEANLARLLPGEWKHVSSRYLDGKSDSTDDVWIIGKQGGLEWRGAIGSDETWLCFWTRSGKNLNVKYHGVNNLTGAPIELIYDWRIDAIDATSMTLFMYSGAVVYQFQK